MCTLKPIKLRPFLSLLFLVGELLYTKGCHPGTDSEVWTVPNGDINLEVGSTLELLCVINEVYAHKNGFTADHIRFYNGTSEIGPEYVIKVNETVAKLHIENTTMMDTMIYCKLFEESNSSYLSNNIDTGVNNRKLSGICLNMVKIGTKPRDVTNFTCISYDWKNLTVTWIPPYNTIPTTYNIFYFPPKRAGRSTIYRCPNATRSNTGCVWNLPEYRYSLDILAFTVEGTNLLGNSSQTFKISTFAHILPNPPSDLKVLEKTESSILLSWDVEKLFALPNGLVFKIEYTWNLSGPWNLIILNSKILGVNSGKVTYNITGLKYPNTPYDFRVYTKSAVAISDEFWSKPNSKIFKTKPAPPYISPKTDIGSFESVTVPNSQNNRDIFLYWKPLSPLEQNGDSFRYDFLIESGTKMVPVTPASFTISYAKFIDYSMDSHRFFIRSANAEGVANTSSEIFIPSKKDLVQEPTVYVKVVYRNGIYELSWSSPIVSMLKDFTVYWCESNRDRPYQCDGDIDWIHLPANTTKHNFTVISNNSYQFAVSANTANSSSGMTWIPCTAHYDHLSKMKNVWVGKTESTSIVVDWRLDCSERIKGIQGYHIYYCVANSEHCIEPEKVLRIYGDVNTARGNITDLIPFTTYRIQVSVILADNRIWPRSDAMINRTAEGAPDMSDVEIKLENVTNSSAEISWNLPRSTNGILRNFEVIYGTKTSIVNGTKTSLNDLESYTYYQVGLKACTTVCSSTKMVDFETEVGRPGPIIAPSWHQINSSYIRVSWSPPDHPAGPSPIYDIRFQSHQDSENLTIKSYQVMNNTTEFQLQSCTDNGIDVSYTVHIRPKNVVQKGDNLIELLGDWSQAYSFSCMHPGFPSFLKFLLIFSLAMFLIVPCIWTNVKTCNWYKRKKMDIILPPNFSENIVMSIEPMTTKMSSYRIGESYWKSKDECDRLNKKTEHTEKECTDAASILIPSENNLITREMNSISEENSSESTDITDTTDRNSDVIAPDMGTVICVCDGQKCELFDLNTGYIKL